MTSSTCLAACCALILLLSLAAAQPNAAVKSPPPVAQRKADIRARMKTNAFINDPVRGEETVRRMVALQDEIIRNGGCNPNLCFGIDGSAQISEEDYGLQLDFMALVVATAGAQLGFEDRMNIAAYQYGGALKAFLRPTSNVERLFEAIENANFRKSRFTFLAPAILACRRDFENLFAEDANKMVIMGDGRTNFRSPRLAINEARMFLPPYNNGAICAITVKNPDVTFLEKVTQDKARVLKIDESKQFLDLLETVVRDVCDIV